MNCRFFVLEGFEPSQAEPESDVLPLHHKAKCICAKFNANLHKKFAIRCFYLKKINDS